MRDPLVPPEETPPAEGSVSEAHEERSDGGMWEHPGIALWLLFLGVALVAGFFVVRLIAL